MVLRRRRRPRRTAQLRHHHAVQVHTGGAGKGYTYACQPISATREVQVSKKMTTMLRHKLDDRHWSPDAEGCVYFGDLKHLLNIRRSERVAIQTDEIIYVVVSGNRFNILWDKDRPAVAMRIRAAQGHSGRGGQLSSDDAAFVRLTASGVASGQQGVTGVCVHGSEFAALLTNLSTSAEGGINPGGLSRKRKHTHYSQHPLSDARMTAGMRRDATEVIYSCAFPRCSVTVRYVTCHQQVCCYLLIG